MEDEQKQRELRERSKGEDRRKVAQGRPEGERRTAGQGLVEEDPGVAETVEETVDEETPEVAEPATAEPPAGDEAGS